MYPPAIGPQRSYSLKSFFVSTRQAEACVVSFSLLYFYNHGLAASGRGNTSSTPRATNNEDSSTVAAVLNPIIYATCRAPRITSPLPLDSSSKFIISKFYELRTELLSLR
jgi:hypothetical protein